MNRLMLVALATVTLMLAGCAGQGAPTPRPSPVAAPGLVPPGWFDGTGAWPSDGWWRAFQTPALDRLIDAALADSPTVATAQARLRVAEQASAATAAVQSTMVGASVDLNEQRLSRNHLTPAQFSGKNLESGRVSLDVGVDPDFWGRNQAALTSALGQQAAARAELAHARLLLSCAIVQAWLGAVADSARLSRAQALFDEQGLHRRLIERRLAEGLDSAQSLERAKLGEQDAALAVERIRQSIDLARNQVSALVGGTPLDAQWLRIDEQALDRLLASAAGVPARLPLQLVGRRPDLAAQLARIDAARAQIEGARAEFYPSVNLAAFVGLQSIGLNQLMSTGSVIGSVGPAIRLPILNGGRLRANLAGREAEFDAVVAQYNQSLVQAVREVADQLTMLSRLDVQSTLREAELQSQRRLEALAERRLERGLDNRARLAEARIGRLASELAQIDLRVARATARVALVRALGGGYGDPSDSQSTR